MSLKIEKHEKIAMWAVSILNTISSLISKALTYDSISDEEYSLLSLEFESFTRMKKDLRIMIVCNVSGSVAMATRNHSTNGTYTRSGHIKTALGIGLRTRPQLISVSRRYIFCLKYLSASRILILFL